MARVDIRVVKNTLRAEFKQKRRQLPQHLKRQKDYSIFKRIVGLNEYKQCEILVCFVSTAIEVDTHKLIRHALDNGKAVAVPRCIDGTSLMQFYLINSLDDLEPGSFSVLEPIVDRCKKIDEFVHSVCIVPGLGFDMKGYRLGYGKGYYDRFLEGYKDKTIGICYNSCLKNLLPHGKYDKPVDILISEKFMKRI